MQVVMDFEEELEANIIKKPTTEENVGRKIESISRPSTEKYKVFDYIPLTFNDLVHLNQDAWKDLNVISIFEGRMHFKNCLVYCTIVGKFEMGEKYVFIADDGTETMEINLWNRKQNYLNIIEKLMSEVDAMQSSMGNLAKCLKNLLTETGNQLFSASDIKPGTRVLVFGKPSYYHENVSLDAFYILNDNSADRKHEIAFKDELIDWYRSNLLPP